MDRITSCVERIRVIKGVNYGVITNEQIQDLFVALDLNKEQQVQVLSILEKEHITPIPEQEVPQKVRDLLVPPSAKAIPKQLDEQTKRQLRRELFDRILNAYRRDLDAAPDLAARYEEELPIFIQAAADLAEKNYRTVYRKMANACMAISDYRIRDTRKSGWVCGTHTSRLRELLEHWMQLVFSEDELLDLIDCCVCAKALTPEQMDQIAVLLHNAPRIHVNYRKPFFEDS